MAELKTFLFTDIVGSVELKGQMPGSSDAERDQAYIEQVLSPHRARIEQELATLGGRVVSTAGDGHFLVFSDTIHAARWAISIERSHRDQPIRTPNGGTVAVRISMHLGIPQIDPRDADNFVGKPVDYASRLNDYATGGQILVSRSVVAVLEDAGMDGVSFHLHGRRDLKGIGLVDVYELVYDATGPRKMRPQPRQETPREWTIVPATIGLTEFHARESSGRFRRSDVLPAPSLPATAPTKLGNYELVERIGGGGMGDVYKARHQQFGRQRAVKVIRPHYVAAGHREVIRRFYQEIKAVGALEHPNIVVAIDSSTPSDAVHYLVMEFIDGIGADELVAYHGPLCVADACEIARQAARGLAYIHQNGMVHRDIKPSNLMLTIVSTESFGSDPGASAEPAGRRAAVKILDLGLALLVGDDQQRLTLFDDRAMGTAMYMSPEQWKTTSVDIRADVYSLGCTLYHLLAGKPPYWDSDLRPEKAHEREKLPSIQSTHPIPRDLWLIIERMTAKRPDERYTDPAEVIAALAPFAAGHKLVELIETTTNRGAVETKAPTRSDTILARASESDTRPVHTPVDWALPKSFPPAKRHAIWQTLSKALLVALVGIIGWLVYQTTQRRGSVEDARTARRESLELAAHFAASEILKEINLRFNILDKLAKNEDLVRMMRNVDAAPSDQSLWKPVEQMLGSEKSDHDKQAPADSWFISNAKGIQVARSPRSDASRGLNYAYRDYFHGLGRDQPTDATDLKPITEPNLSAVYRSTSTGKYRVAFSVPIVSVRQGVSRVLGVLAMSVDLGEFNVLEKRLPAGHEVVLIDLRESVLDGPPRRGLILHRQFPAAVATTEPTANFVSPALLARIDDTLDKNKSAPIGRSFFLPDYKDPAVTGDKLYWGAIERVVDQPADEPPRDTGWLVLVQEPVAKQ
jgi:serine/threonine protein kinase/class 3 adenylate cyclase